MCKILSHSHSLTIKSGTVHSSSHAFQLNADQWPIYKGPEGLMYAFLTFTLLQPLTESSGGSGGPHPSAFQLPPDDVVLKLELC